jgi:hypothetical protein
MKTEANTARDKKNGQYAHSIEAVCVCGHELGAHTADAYGGARPCLMGTDPTDPATLSADALPNDLFDPNGPCDCEKFRKSRRKA